MACAFCWRQRKEPANLTLAYAEEVLQEAKVRRRLETTRWRKKFAMDEWNDKDNWLTGSCKVKWRHTTSHPLISSKSIGKFFENLNLVCWSVPRRIEQNRKKCRQEQTDRQTDTIINDRTVLTIRNHKHNNNRTYDSVTQMNSCRREQLLDYKLELPRRKKKKTRFGYISWEIKINSWKAEQKRGYTT